MNKRNSIKRSEVLKILRVGIMSAVLIFSISLFCSQKNMGKGRGGGERRKIHFYSGKLIERRFKKQ